MLMPDMLNYMLRSISVGIPAGPAKLPAVGGWLDKGHASATDFRWPPEACPRLLPRCRADTNWPEIKAKTPEQLEKQ
jgi:hypothetical protein